MRGGYASILYDAYDICIDKSGAMVAGTQLLRPRTQSGNLRGGGTSADDGLHARINLMGNNKNVSIWLTQVHVLCTPVRAFLAELDHFPASNLISRNLGPTRPTSGIFHRQNNAASSGQSRALHCRLGFVQCTEMCCVLIGHLHRLFVFCQLARQVESTAVMRPVARLAAVQGTGRSTGNLGVPSAEERA